MTQSPLLRLPGELRNKIFAYAVGGYIITAKRPILHEPSDDEADWYCPRFEDDSDNRLKFCLTTTVQPQVPREPDAISYHSDYYINDCVPWDPFLEGKTSTSVSRIFTVGYVCRQIYTETALLQYKTNYFHFDTPVFIDLFLMQLTFDQRRAIPAISIGDGYLVQEDWCYQAVTPGSLRQFSRLRKIYLVPEIMGWTDALTPRDKLVKMARKLRLDVTENAGLWIGLFDVFDETAVLQDAFGITIKSAAGEA
ncbi:hypothetical protein J4E93_006238 [Alternaria ventricosa]|uniref:uncharacterized protein n=1 Tax=Alternaria ventricosa TaxID=1187951 RepID=UPI0020C29A17|nr:uncharacterized protein J4E93_006238 [Alternaria ventricosa]KAI4644337.1 hypothetical protein J4E93_006238 [Alternaria ventricosa]